jgi:hypothetical protein
MLLLMLLLLLWIAPRRAAFLILAGVSQEPTRRWLLRRIPIVHIYAASTVVSAADSLEGIQIVFDMRTHCMAAESINVQFQGVQEVKKERDLVD